MVLREGQISSQYVRQNQITVTILDVVDPAHFIVKESPTLDSSSEAKLFAEAEEAMQKYYESLEQVFFQLPLKDSVIVVLHGKKFYRAKVIRILTQSSGHLFKVYLVDYGEECSVPRECIYEIQKDFLKHPFQAVDVKLLGIEPISLLMNSTDLSMSYGPVTDWDPSAVIYIQDVQRGMCNAYIEVKAIDEQYIYGSLFICYNDNTVKCINDELISNTFAWFNNSCWEKVHRIEDILGNISNESTDEGQSSTSEHVNPKEMSSSASLSKTEPEFQDLTTMFLRPDGKILAKSSFTKIDALDSKPEVQEESLEPQVQEIRRSVSSVLSEAVSPDQRALNISRFQKLQMLNRKKYSANKSASVDTVNEITPLVVNEALGENAASNVNANTIESNSKELDVVERGKTSKRISSSDSYVNSHNIGDQSNVVNSTVCAVSENRQKKETISQQVDAVACRRFQKLRELCRKRQTSQPSSNKQSADSTNTTSVENNSAEVSSDKTESSFNYSDVDESGESISNNSTLNASIPNKSSDIDNFTSTDLEPHMPEDTASKILQKKECITEEEQIIARRKFEKLRLLNRRQLPSPICQSAVNKYLSAVIQKRENKADDLAISADKINNNTIASNTLKSERTQSDNASLNNLMSRDCQDYGSQTPARSEILCKSSESSQKQETKPHVVSKNLNTFKKLQQKVRMKMIKTSTSSSTPDSLENIGKVSGIKCSSKSPIDNSSLISSNSEQMPISSSISEMISSPCKESSLMSHHRGVNFEKVKLTQSTVAIQESNLTEDVTRISEPKTPDILSLKQETLQTEIISSGYSSPIQQPESDLSDACLETSAVCLADKSKYPISVSNESLSRISGKVKKSPLHKSRNLECDDLEMSHMEPQQSEILKELLVMSDSDDLLCSISNQKDERFYDNGDVEENYIELSTQLKHSDPKQIEFNELSLWEKQKVPALLIGVGLTHPVLKVEEANFSEHVIRVLKEIKFYGPSCIQSVIWPFMDKNRCMVAVAPPHSGKTVAYALPLVSSFTEEESPKLNNNGPSTIVLCSSWLKAQAVYDLFHFFLGNKKMKIITLCTDGGHYRHSVVSLINSCDVLIATPYCLLQFLKDDSIKLGQLDNLILDDSTALMDKHKKELKNILLSYLYAAKRNKNTPQLMLFAERWNKNFHVILDKMMSNPLIFFTSFLESAIFAKVSIFAHVCGPDEKKNVLLSIIKNAVKVVICTTNRKDAVDVHHFLRCEDVTTFLVNEEMEHYISDEVIKDWKSIKCTTTSHCLVITDQALIEMCISNATCLVHYDLPPESRLQFGNRFSCIAEHFQETKPTCVSHIFITESEYYHAPQIVEIIQNSGGTPSEDLMELCKKQNQVESTSDLLCPYLKAFGFCKEHQCKNRHVVDAEKDKPQIMPCEGDIRGFVTHIVDASHFYIRLLKYLNPVSNKTVSLISTYAEIGFQLRDFYSRAPADLKVESPTVGEIYVLAEENNLFYRIKVLKQVNCHSLTTLPSWKVLFLDEGWIKYYEKLELYKVSDEIKLPDPVAVEVYVCNLIPLDSCFDWNPQTSQLMSNLIKGKEIHGKIVLCLGKTLWLDPVVSILHLSNANEFVNLFKLNQKLIECGHARQNKNHLTNLRQACTGKIPLPNIAKPNIKKENKAVKQTHEINYAFLECNTYEDVYVSSVISPHQLYVQRAKFVECLDNLLDEINEQVKNRALKKAHTVYKGLHCIAPFYEDDRYYRAVITDVLSYTEVQLFYVDFGDSAKVSRNNVYFLPAEFLLLPFQAIECELAGVAAAHGGWTDSAVDALMMFTRDEAGDMKILQLKAYKKSSCYDGGNHYVIDLWFDGKNLSDQLLQAGFGIPVEVDEIPLSPVKSHNISSKSLSDEEFDLSEKEPLTEEDMSADDKDAAALFYNCVAEMVLQSNNIIPKPGVEITEVSSDDEICVSKSNESNKLPCAKVCNDLVKLLPKMNSGNKDEVQLESFSTSQRPLITWWDTPEQLNVLINLKEAKNYQLIVTDEGFNFNTIIAGVQYLANEILYDQIHSSDANKYQSFQGINIVVKKRTPFKWPRLTKEKKRFLHIKYDLIHIDDSDTDEQSANTKKKNFRPEYAMDEGSSTTDEDEKYVEPWRDFAQQKNPFSAFD